MKLPPNKSQHIDFACQFKHLLRILTRLGVWARTLTNIECGFRLLKRAIEIGPPIYTSCPSADPAPGQRMRLCAAKREGRLTPGGPDYADSRDSPNLPMPITAGIPPCSLRLKPRLH